MKTKKSWMVPSIEAAFEKAGRPKVDFSVFPEDLREHMEGYYNAVVVVEAVNEGAKPDWEKSTLKWAPWFRMAPSGFAFCGSGYDITGAIAGSGSRLRLESEEKSNYVATQFPEVWKAVQLK